MALNAIGDRTMLYLAIPKDAYEGLYDEPVGRMVLAGAEIQLIVYDPVKVDLS